jgi:hypothetical protein
MALRLSSGTRRHQHASANHRCALTPIGHQLAWWIATLSQLVFRLWLLLIAGSALAQSTVTGSIAVDTHWTVADSPFLLSDVTTLQGGATLIIDPGVTIYMAARASFVFEQGSLTLAGTATKPIHIRSDKVRLGLAPAAGDWGRWFFARGSQQATLNHVIFEDGQGLQMQAAAVELNFVDIRNQSGPAITIDLASSLSGVGNHASGNAIDGVLVPSGDIAGSLHWTLRGIPFVLDSGILSVGTSPKVTAIQPQSIEQGDTASFTITGSRLGGLSDASVSGSGASVEILPGGNESQVYLSITTNPGAALGPVSLRMLTDAGQIMVPNAVRILQAQPYIDGLSLSNLIVNQGMVDLTVTGRHFNSGSQMVFAGAAVATTFIDSSHLSARLSAPTQTGNPTMQVRSPDPSGSAPYLQSNALVLPVLASGLLRLDPANPSIVIGRSKPMTVVLPYAAPTPGFTVNLASSVPAFATVPSTVFVTAGQTRASFDVAGLQEGVTIVTASLPGFVSAQSPIQVTQTVTYSIGPVPLIALPGGKSRSFTIVASDINPVPVTFTASIANPSIATIATPSLTLPAGETQSSGTLTGVAAGTTTLAVTAVGANSVPFETQLFVGTDLAGGAAAYAKPVGLLRNSAAVATPIGATVGPVSAKPLGLLRSDSTVVVPIGASVGPVAAHPLGLLRNDSTVAVPVGAPVGPVSAYPLGLLRNDSTIAVPIGATVGPVPANPLGLVRNSSAVVAPAGAVVGPVAAPPVGLTKP